MTFERVRRPRVGLVVNPIAGIGGAVGLKGSDGPDTPALALARGAIPHATERAVAALSALVQRWPVGVERFELLAAPGPMGQDAGRAAGVEVSSTVGALPATTTSADDTRRITIALAQRDLDLLLFAGGDGTARDVCAALLDSVGLPVLGIPAGVKIQSAVFATSPRASGELAAIFLTAEGRRTSPREVLDLDEEAYRDGRVAPRLYGELDVPIEPRRVQARKEPSPRSETAAAASIAEEVAALLVPGRRYVLGPGSTTRAIAERLGVPKTLVGVDVVDAIGGSAAHGGDEGDRAAVVRLIAADVGERELLSLLPDGDASVVVTPIGGQGFVFGRGNQQIAASVVQRILQRGGRDRIIVVATPAKLAGLRGRPLLVDTGDAMLDAALAGHCSVVTGRGERTIYPVAPA